jgi:hypothetical protein
LVLRAASWTGLQSPIETSKPITGETTYTLTCKDLSGQIVTKQTKVRVGSVSKRNGSYRAELDVYPRLSVRDNRSPNEPLQA